MKSTNIRWHAAHVTRQDREARNGHKGVILWFTGLSGSGKSTVSIEVEKELHTHGCQTYVLDGDNIRYGLNRDLGFSPADRTENIRRIGEVARLFVDAGVIVSAAFISPYRSDRDAVRALAGPGDFIEVYVECPVDVCEQRDPKGLYKKAREGALSEFTGVSAPYEAPHAPEITLHTDTQSVSECAASVIGYLRAHGYVH
ncbi:adenylyl-sulfate kinase [bacterium]|nr:adenylyl-sulfate kinase [bacterium]